MPKVLRSGRRCAGIAKLSKKSIHLFVDGSRVNDQFGHAVGDAVVVAVANRFARELPPHAVMARLGGDEFAIVAEGDSSLAKALADRLSRSLLEPITACGQLVELGCDFGQG